MTNEQLVSRIQAGENVAENMLQLYEQNKGFIYKMAVKYSQFAELEDLEQEGFIGLSEAVSHYNPEQDALFMTYAAFWIKQVMMRYIENCGSLVRIPTNAKQLIIKYKKTFGEYKKWYGKEPSDREMRAFLHVRQEKIEDIKKSLRMDDIQSLSKPVGGEDGDIILSDSVASDYDLEEDCSRRLDRQQLKHDVKEVLESLPEDQQKVIQYRFFDRMTLKEAGEQLGIKAQQARQLEAKVMRKLRYPGRCKKIESYHEQYLSAGPVHHIGVNTYLRTWTSAVEAELGLW